MTHESRNYELRLRANDDYISTCLLHKLLCRDPNIGQQGAPSASSSRKSSSLLRKRDSSLSVASSCSVDSDWSDEELDELERILDDIQERSELKKSAQERWKRLKKSRAVAMHRLKLLKRLSSSSLGESQSGSSITTESFKTADENEPVEDILEDQFDLESRINLKGSSPLDSPKLRRMRRMERNVSFKI